MVSLLPATAPLYPTPISCRSLANPSLAPTTIPFARLLHVACKFKQPVERCCMLPCFALALPWVHAVAAPHEAMQALTRHNCSTQQRMTHSHGMQRTCSIKVYNPPPCMGSRCSSSITFKKWACKSQPSNPTLQVHAVHMLSGSWMDR